MTRPLLSLNATFSNEAALTSFAVLQDGTQIAVGFSTGTLLLFSGYFLKDNVQTRPPPPVALMLNHKFPISGLNFCEIPTNKLNDRKIRLFTVLDSNILKNIDNNNQNLKNLNNESNFVDSGDPTSAGILVFDTSVTLNASGNFVPSNSRQQVKILDERGVVSKCSSFMKCTSELVVGRSEAVYNYSVDDIGGALAIFGEKLCVSAVGRYTLVASVEEKNNVASTAVNNNNSLLNSNAMGILATTITAENKPKKTHINIYDLKNKIICGTVKKYTLSSSSEKIFLIANDSGAAYILTSSWSLIRFREKDTNRKLDVLLNSKPPLFSLAIMLAAEEQIDPSEIMKLYKVFICLFNLFFLYYCIIIL
jgi:hypothetical protein